MTEPARLRSLDAFRGAAVAGMIFVNASADAPAPVLAQHMPWHGWTPADLIFPAFLFILGAAIPFSCGKRLEQGQSPRALALRACKRAVILIALGLLGGIGAAPEGALRIPGVLQRIGLCYLAASLAFLRASPAALAGLTAALLAGYWALLAFVPVPGFGPGDLSPEGNLASYLDRLVFDGRMLTVVHDAEGLLSTIPAAATSLAGVLAGLWLRAPRAAAAKAAGLAGAGAAGIALGLLWARAVPLNKHLYTSSFALLSCGLSAGLLALLHWLVDLRGQRAWIRPFELLGAHALLAYMGSGLGETLLDAARLAPRESLAGWLPPARATAAWALAWTLLWYAAIRAADRARSRLKRRPA